MDKEEQIEILNGLRRGQQVFLAALEGITEDNRQRSVRPLSAAQRWSSPLPVSMKESGMPIKSNPSIFYWRVT
jgi:hypothetical protein